MTALDGEDGEAQQLVGFEAHLEKGQTEYVATVEQQAHDHLTRYTHLTQHTTSLYKYKSCDHNRGGTSSCAHDDEWGSADKPMYYNNLICDFSRARLDVDEVDDSTWTCSCYQNIVQQHARRFWVAQLEPLNIPSFQHAACQWRTGTKQLNTQSYKRTFTSQHALHHLHIFHMDDSVDAEGVDGVEFDEESGSEVYDENEWAEWHNVDRPRKERVDVQNMLARPAADADYIFVTQYAAIHVM